MSERLDVPTPGAARRRVLTLRHRASDRLVPAEVPTVFGRSDSYYRYRPEDERADRLRPDVVDGLAALNYIKICSDERVSRTHGLLEPAGPGIRDLNSTNGTLVNGRPIPTRYGERGPLLELADGDRIAVGRQAFDVELWEVTEDEHSQRLERARLAVVGADAARSARAARIAAFLRERKGFAVSEVRGWQAVISQLYRLQQQADPEGLVVLALAAELRRDDLVLRTDEQEVEMPLGKLLPLLSSVPGRKVLALDGDGDPTACERLFARIAYEDAVLLTSPGPVELIEPVEHSLRTDLLRDVRDSVSGAHPLQGAYDDPLDGLDALIGPDTNILNVTWVGAYRGRLRVIFGSRVRQDDLAISHSLRFGSTTFRF